MAKIDAQSFIDKVGSSKIERAVNVGPKSVHAAKAKNLFPASWFNALEALAKRHGVELRRTAFNWKSPAKKASAK